jgi:hypothetical protein
MIVLTPSYEPDFGLCVDLQRSILAHSPDSVEHHIVVPRSDIDLFRQLDGARVQIHDVTEILPRSFRQLPGANVWTNLWRPFPPVRGWIAQQILKLAAAARSDADVVLLVDSDVVFVRPFTADTFIQGGVVRFYRREDAIPGDKDRHVRWHQNARRLLGLPPGRPPFHDYICWPGPWSPKIVRAMLRRVEHVTGRRWPTAIGSRLHFSEMILYGVYVDEILGAPANTYASDDMHCVNYFDEVPLDADDLHEFLGRIDNDDLAVMISAKSHTPLSLRRRALANLSTEPR